MKKLFTIAFALVGFSVIAQSQEKVAPAKEYVVSLSESTIKIAQGESKQVTVTLLRSKTFTKSTATLGVSSSLPKGITIAYEPATGVVESSVATISVTPEAKEGEYQIILNSTLKNLRKGSILKVVVEGSAVPKDAVSLN